MSGRRRGDGNDTIASRERGLNTSVDHLHACLEGLCVNLRRFQAGQARVQVSQAFGLLPGETYEVRDGSSQRLSMCPPVQE